MLNNYDVLLDGGRDIKVGGACDFYNIFEHPYNHKCFQIVNMLLNVFNFYVL